jgi:hypothetical protein
MTKLTGMDLNIEKSSDGTNNNQWSLFFNPGYFSNESNTMFRKTESSVLKLKKLDYNCPISCGYHIYYNPDNNKYNVIDSEEHYDLSCHDYGYNIGGFVVKNCKLVFVYPKDCENIEYRRGFGDEYNSA